MGAMKKVVQLLIAICAASLIVGCSSDTQSPPESTASGTATEQFPDVVEAVVSRDSEGTYSFDVTMTSPYDTVDRYADGWRILDPAGAVLGEMTLDHDHASEQPFTRTQTGVEIPDGVTEVNVEGRDILSGYGGTTKSVAIPAP